MIRDYLRRLTDVYEEPGGARRRPGGRGRRRGLASRAACPRPGRRSAASPRAACASPGARPGSTSAATPRRRAVPGALRRPAAGRERARRHRDRQQKRRFRPFDWRGQSSEVSLNAAIPWTVSLRGGMWKLSADLRGLRLESLDVTGGASDVEIWLPAAGRHRAGAHLRRGSSVTASTVPPRRRLRAAFEWRRQPARVRRSAAGGGRRAVTSVHARLRRRDGPLRGAFLGRREPGHGRRGLSRMPRLPRRAGGTRGTRPGASHRANAGGSPWAARTAAGHRAR